MRIDRNLRVTSRSQLADGTPVFLYHAPIGLDTWDEYCLTLTKLSRNILEGSGIALGPHNAYSLLIATAKKDDVLADIKTGFLSELVRQTTCAVMRNGETKTFPLYELQKEGAEQFDVQDYRDILSGLVFFTCIYRATPPGVTIGLLAKIQSLTTLRITHSSYTEFLTSLTTSTTGENTGETAEGETQ